MEDPSGEVLWRPPPGGDPAAVTRFAAFARDEAGGRGGGPASDDYGALWEWSVRDLAGFWGALSRFFGVRWRTAPSEVLGSDAMPGAAWFPGATLNYAEHALRRRGADPAVVSENEAGPCSVMSFDELAGSVGAWAATLRALGVEPGDRVVGVLPNIPEALVALLGSAAVGAVWACCGPDLALASIADRLGQLAPTVLVASTGYRYGGRVHPGPTLDRLRQALPSVRHVVVVRYPEPGGRASPGRRQQASPRRRQPSPEPAPRVGRRAAGTIRWDDVVSAPVEPEFEAVAFDHPLWVLFTSGTTGLPKGIVHGHGGIVVEHLKLLGIHADLRPDDRLAWYTSTSWMMWNYLVAGLLHGAAVVLYDGSPSWPTPDAWWRVAGRSEVSVLGTSPAYLLSCRRHDAGPERVPALRRLRSLGVTGSPLPGALHRWAAEQLGGAVPVQSVSGGTDVCSAFLAGLPTLPVVAGRLQCRALGAAVEAWDSRGRPVVGRTGELVITRPMPSMPLSLWGDEGHRRYRETYFEPYPRAWRHGDWVTVLRDGSAVVHGRSDSTLNRHGVRAGTGELYQAVEAMAEVDEALAVALDHEDGSAEIVVFVALADGRLLDDELSAAVRRAVRDRVSPRQVPDRVVQVPGIPHTLTGKKLEVPVRRILAGADPSAVAALGAVDRPELLQHFVAVAATLVPVDGVEG